jgi:two-component sensor histidine kinase
LPYAFRRRRVAESAPTVVDAETGGAAEPGNVAPADQLNLRDSLPVVYDKMRTGIALARGTLALTCAASVLLDRRYRRRPRAHLAVGLVVAQWLHDDLALRSGREAALWRVRWLSPVLTALAQLSLPHLPSDREGSEINWFYGGGVWVAPAVALAGGRHAPVTASVSQFPLVWRAVRDPAFRAFAVGIHLSIGFLTVTARLLGDSGAHANAMFDRVAAERRDAAESEAAVASMREALGPAIDELEALEALLVAEPRSLVLERCRRLEERSRHLQLTRELRAGPVPSWDDRAARRELRIRMRRVAGVAYTSSFAWCVLDSVEGVRRGLISPARAAASTGLLFTLAGWGILDRGPMLTGVGTAATRGRTLLSGLLGGVISAELHRGAATPGFDTSVRDQVQLQSSALAASSRDLAWGQLISTTVGGWYEWRNLGRTERPAYAALILGYSWGLPQSLHLFLSGIWEAQRQNDLARRHQVESAARRGRAQGAEWAARASHDYVAQSLLHLQQHPDLDHDAALAVLGDARTKLEQALAQGTVEFASDLTEMLAECVHGYRVFGLEARLDVRSEDDLAPAANTLGEASGQALLLALNQGLGNVLAHSSDRHPTVEVTVNQGSAQLRLTNRTDTLAETDPEPGLGRGGYGLAAVEAAVAELGGRCELVVGREMTVFAVDLPVDAPMTPTGDG